MNRLFLALSIAMFGIISTSSYGVESTAESWYTYWEIGYPTISYPGEVQDAVDLLEDIPGVDRTRINFGLLGFYWPLANNKTMLGGIIDGCGDEFEVFGESMQINQYQYSFSCMHFLQNNIGKGFFLRGDVGFSRLVVQLEGYGDETSDWGFGMLAGCGYGIPITPGTRLMLNANFSVKQIEGDSISKFTFSIGGLF